jgi:hypothetical protein
MASLATGILLGGHFAKGASLRHLSQRKNFEMPGSNELKLDPTVDQEAVLNETRRIILEVAPYSGVLSITLPQLDDTERPGMPLRLTSDRVLIPRSARSQFGSIDQPGAGKAALDLLVLFRERLAYRGQLVVTLHEAEDNDPLVGLRGEDATYLEFGAVRSEGYRMP